MKAVGDDDSLSGGAIAGIVISVLVFFVILAVLGVLLGVWLYKQRKNKSRPSVSAFETQGIYPRTHYT